MSMKSIFQIQFPNDKPWIILGKGPSFSKVWRNLNIEDYYSIGLNHVPTTLKVDYGHRIDYWGLPGYFDTNCKNVIMPFRPHINYKPSDTTLHSLAVTDPVINKLSRQDRLFYYDHSKVSKTENRPKGIGPVVKVHYFSSEAVFHILLLHGITKIYSLGIDGGTDYADEFKIYQKPLNNGQPDFDKQIPAIEKLMNKYNAIWRRL